MGNRRLFSLGILLPMLLLGHVAAQIKSLICSQACSNAGMDAEFYVMDKTDIPKGVTLSPFWGWKIAAECLRRYQKNSGCRGKQLLTLDGVIEVDISQVKDYCAERGCGNHTKGVLQCIHSVKRSFHFANRAKPMPMYNAITDTCNALSALNQSSYTYTSSAMKLFASNWISFLSAVASMVLLMMMKL